MDAQDFPGNVLQNEKAEKCCESFWDWEGYVHDIILIKGNGTIVFVMRVIGRG